jgi:hypothetical protein
MEYKAIVNFGKGFTLKAQHQPLVSLWDEYKGREERWKSYWRTHLDNQQNSRTRHLIEGINNYVGRENLLLGDAIAHLEEFYTSNKYSVYKMCEWLKDDKLLNNKAAPGRKPKSNTGSVD